MALESHLFLQEIDPHSWFMVVFPSVIRSFSGGFPDLSKVATPNFVADVDTYNIHKGVLAAATGCIETSWWNSISSQSHSQARKYDRRQPRGLPGLGKMCFWFPAPGKRPRLTLFLFRYMLGMKILSGFSGSCSQTMKKGFLLTTKPVWLMDGFSGFFRVFFDRGSL